ncbi:MAG: hypothetical protein R3C19_15350 [Planctomycetaceae bacterium]
MAFRRRIQSQRLCHNVGKSVAAKVVMRFRKAGTWDGGIAPESPPELGEIRPTRSSIPTAVARRPLVVVLEDEARGIIDVDEHFLSQDSEIRLAALKHFLVLNRKRSAGYLLCAQPSQTEFGCTSVQ